MSVESSTIGSQTDHAVLEGAREARDGLIVNRGYFETFDNTRLYFVRWSDDTAEASEQGPVIVLMHGYGEHVERYHDLASRLVSAGYPVCGFDARGHGRSDGRRAYVERFEDYAHDLRMFVSHVAVRYPDRPRVLIGHSNGGLIAIRFVQLHSDLVDALIATGPVFGLTVKIPKWKAVMGRVFSKLWPTLALANEIKPEHVTRTPEIVEAYATDPLINRVATARYFTEMQAAGDRARAQVSQLRLPLWIIQGGTDLLVDPEATRAFADMLVGEDVTYDDLPDHYHEIFNEPDRFDQFERVVAWIDERFATGTDTQRASEAELAADTDHGSSHA